MKPLRLLLPGCLALAACTATPPTQPHAPPFAQIPYEPFSAATVAAIALREWRLFGSPVDDDPPGKRPRPLPDDKPERRPGLWQRVGEYWWMGLDPGARESGWTGKHGSDGGVFPADQDERYAWSAAFVSYVMRIAGAGRFFPYAPDHAAYINAAISTPGRWVIAAERLEAYAPRPGDLICLGRGAAAGLRFADLPAGHFPAHCDIVVDTAEPGQIAVVGGNVDDAVTLKHVPVTAAGRLAEADGTVLDTRYPWMLVLRVAPNPPQPVS
jgi:hypothetical protein